MVLQLQVLHLNHKANLIMLKRLIMKHSLLIQKQQQTKDPAISGITLSKSTTNKVRLDVTSGKALY